MLKPALTFVAVLLASPLMGRDAAMVEDTNGDGTFSLAEMSVAYPGMTEALFARIDTSADGEVDLTEWEAAVGAGLLPTG